MPWEKTVSVGPTSVSAPVTPFGAFQMPSTTGRSPLQVLGLEAGDLREASRRDRRVALRREAVEERQLQLGAGERLDHGPVPEGENGEHLAPGDLAGRLAGAGRGAVEVGPEAARVRVGSVHAGVLEAHGVGHLGEPAARGVAASQVQVDLDRAAGPAGLRLADRLARGRAAVGRLRL